MELGDFLWPKLHARWWNWDDEKGRSKTGEELYEGLRSENLDQARETLEHAQEIADTAIERAGAADRRATAIAGTVAIAASFTLGGAGILIDPAAITDLGNRRAFAIVLCATTVAFIVSAIFALRALVGTRTLAWSNIHDLPLDPNEPRAQRLGMRAAHLLEDFAFNWEISDLKNRNVDRALVFLTVALIGIAALASLLVLYVV